MKYILEIILNFNMNFFIMFFDCINVLFRRGLLIRLGSYQQPMPRNLPILYFGIWLGGRRAESGPFASKINNNKKCVVGFCLSSSSGSRSVCSLKAMDDIHIWSLLQNLV